MSDVTDLRRKLDRASYDLDKSLVKLDGVQKHPELPIASPVAEVKKYLADLHIVIGQIERLEMLQDGSEAKVESDADYLS